MVTDGGGYTLYPIKAGLRTGKPTPKQSPSNSCCTTARVSDSDSCAEVGMQLAVPRTSAHFASMLKQFGKRYFKVVPGVYGDRPGDYRSYAMSSFGKDAAKVILIRVHLLL